MKQDRYGNPCSTNSSEAIDRYNEALELIRLYRGDPVAALDAALVADPQFGGAWAARAGLLVQQTDAAYAGEIASSLQAGAAARLNEREGRHLEAARDWAEGRFHQGTARLARIAQDHPHDVLALQYGSDDEDVVVGRPSSTLSPSSNLLRRSRSTLNNNLLLSTVSDHSPRHSEYPSRRRHPASVRRGDSHR